MTIIRERCKRTVTWEMRVLAAVGALTLSSIAAYIFLPGQDFGAIGLVISLSATACTLLTPSCLFWSKGNISYARAAFAAAIMPSISALVAGETVAILLLLTSGGRGGHLANALHDIYRMPFFFLVFMQLFSVGLINLVSVPIGIAVAAFGARRWKALSARAHRQ